MRAGDQKLNILLEWPYVRVTFEVVHLTDQLVYGSFLPLRTEPGQTWCSFDGGGATRAAEADDRFCWSPLTFDLNF